MDNLQIFKKNSELLLDLTKKYELLIQKNGSKVEKKKLEAYIQSLLKNIERNIKENVKEPS